MFPGPFFHYFCEILKKPFIPHRKFFTIFFNFYIRLFFSSEKADECWKTSRTTQKGQDVRAAFKGMRGGAYSPTFSIFLPPSLLLKLSAKVKDQRGEERWWVGGKRASGV